MTKITTKEEAIERFESINKQLQEFVHFFRDSSNDVSNWRFVPVNLADSNAYGILRRAYNSIHDHLVEAEEATDKVIRTLKTIK